MLPDPGWSGLCHVSCSAVLDGALPDLVKNEGTNAIQEIAESVNVLGAEECREIRLAVSVLLECSSTIGRGRHRIPSSPD
jgi:hypothetical protein